MLLISNVGVSADLQSLLAGHRTMKRFFLLPLLFSLSAANVTTMTDKILKDILKDYNPGSRPTGNLTDRKLSYKIVDQKSLCCMSPPNVAFV